MMRSAILMVVLTAVLAQDECDGVCGDDTMCLGGTCHSKCAKSSGCCSPTDKCMDEYVSKCVCRFDEFCCNNHWDVQCVTQAMDRCHMNCDGKPTVKPFKINQGVESQPYQGRMDTPLDEPCHGAEFRANEPLRALPELRSENGFLETTLVVRGNPVSWTSDEQYSPGVSANLRNYNCSILGPLLRFRRGDRVQVTLINKLGLNGMLEIPRREGMVGVDNGHRENQPTVGISSDKWQNVGQSDPNFGIDTTNGLEVEGITDFEYLNSGPTRMMGHHNNYHEPNTTNLHTHGLHVSQQYGQDNVMMVNVYPEGDKRGSNKFTYSYEVSPYHAGGTMWAHAHWHGSVAPQVAQGLNMGLWVEDEYDEVAEPVASAKELFLVIMEHPFNPYGSDDGISPDDPIDGCMPFGSRQTFMCALQHRMGLLAALTGDTMYKPILNAGREADGANPAYPHFFSVNGQYQPHHEMHTDEWYRVRFCYAGHNIPLKLAIHNEDDEYDGCEWKLLAKDSVMVEEYPRDSTNKNMWLGPAGRVDVLLKCDKPGNYKIFQDNYRSDWQKTMDELNIPRFDETLDTSFDRSWIQTLLTLRVTGKDVSENPTAWPLPVKAPRPKYLRDLNSLPYDDISAPNVDNAPVCAEGTGNDPQDCRQPYVQALLLDENDASKKTLNMVMDYDFPTGKTLGPDANANTSYATAPVRFMINMETSKEGMINGKKNDAAYQAVYQVGDILRIALGGLKRHSWHIHEMPFQFETLPCQNENEAQNPWCTNGERDNIGFTMEENFGSFFEVGDWHDAVMIMPAFAYSVAGDNKNPSNPAYPNIPTRTLADCYTGPVMIHCHVLYHEDLGMMTMINIEGDEGHVNAAAEADDMRNNQYPFTLPPPQCTIPGHRCAPASCSPTYKYAPGDPDESYIIHETLNEY